LNDNLYKYTMSVLKAVKARITSRKAMVIFSAILISSVMSGCASKKKPDLLTQEERAELLQQKIEDFYTKAKKNLDKGNYAQAVEDFSVLQRIFPFGDLTEQSKLDTIFALDKLGNRDRAVRIADSFISLHPTHPNVDYAYYMRGVVMFEKKRGRIARILDGGKNHARDPQAYRTSQASFEELVKRYPESKYADDARQRIVFIKNKLAKRELDVAQFYFDNETYLAAVNRCKDIINQYETTPSVEGALILMEKSYAKMGLDELAQSTHEMLLVNFPDNQEKAYSKSRKTLLSRLNPLNLF